MKRLPKDLAETYYNVQIIYYFEGWTYKKYNRVSHKYENESKLFSSYEELFDSLEKEENKNEGRN